MTTIMTLFITFVILAILFYLFYRVKTPYYRIDKERMGQQCVDIEEAEYIGEQKPPYLFSSQGLIKIEKILKQLMPIK